MGTVWLGRDETLGRVVALKRVGVPPGGDSPDVARAEREAKMAARLSHPNVVSVYDLAPDGEQQWLVMEYVEGTNLAELIRANGTLPLDQAAPILAQVAEAIAAAHEAGVVHRDIKPSNILVTPEGQVKLSDFGIARSIGDPSLTQTGLVTGSPAYLSPEVASGGSATEMSDVWSLGATAYHAIEGHPPYEVGDNLFGALYRIVHEEPPRPTTPGWLTPLFEATMVRNEAERWNAAEVRAFLVAGPSATRPTRERRLPRASPASGPPPAGQRTQVVSASGTQTRESPAVPGPLPAAARGGRARPWWLALVAALLAAGMVAAILFAVFQDPRGTTREASGVPSPTKSASSPATTPTADGITAFVTRYLATAPVDQKAGFDMLTPAYRQESRGLETYSAFWQRVSDIKVRSLQGDPQGLVATYTYSYRLGQTPKDENIVFRLTFENGTYLISGATATPARPLT